MHAIGIDIGGTKIAGAVVDEHGSYRRLHRDGGRRRRSNRLGRHRHDRTAVGAASRDGSGCRRARLRERLQLEVTVDNDANVAGWAEFRFGVGQVVDAMTMLTIGTGVGGAITRSHPRAALDSNDRRKRSCCIGSSRT